MEEYAICSDNISFSYADKPVINNLSLRVRPSGHIGILGGSGCGKSTLLKILAGLYAPDQGSLLLAGRRSPEEIRTQTALVMQRSSLFPLSIRDNITCGHAFPEEKIWAACENAGLAHWIRQLPTGLDTPVGERGNQVSGGQAQRIQIARALCKDAPVILLDEPVSALDQDTGLFVLDALRRLTEGRTVVHVTHHRETLDDSYRVYRMEKGGLIDA